MRTKAASSRTITSWAWGQTLTALGTQRGALSVGRGSATTNAQRLTKPKGQRADLGRAVNAYKCNTPTQTDSVLNCMNAPLASLTRT